MEDDIIQFCKKNGYEYLKISNDKSLKIIHDLYSNNTVTLINEEIELYYYGFWYYIKEEYETAKIYLLQLIDKNNSDYMCLLGHIYNQLDDIDNMKKCYNISIEQGGLPAIRSLGSYYKDEKDYDNAKKYFLIGVEKGDHRSITHLGIIYDDLKDPENAIKYYLMAIEKGDADAMYEFAKFYKNKDNLEIYKQYLLMAIKHDHPEALYDMGCICNDKGDSYGAMTFWLKAVEYDHVLSMVSIGNYYHDVKIYDEMIKYYEMAVEEDNVESMIKLAEYYKSIQNTDKMIEYYNRAFENGSDDAFYALFSHYRNDLEKKIILCYECGKQAHLIDCLSDYLKKTDQVFISPKIYEIIEKINLNECKNAPFYLQMVIKLLQTKTEALILHYQYSPEGQGYEEARADFYKKNLDYSLKRPLNTLDKYFEPRNKKMKLSSN